MDAASMFDAYAHPFISDLGCLGRANWSSTVHRFIVFMNLRVADPPSGTGQSPSNQREMIQSSEAARIWAVTLLVSFA